MEHHKRGHVKLHAVELRSEASCSVHAVCVFWLESAEARDEQYSHADVHKHRRQQQRDTFACRRKFECRAEGSWTESVGWGTSKPLCTTLYRRRTTLAPARSPQAFLQILSQAGLGNRKTKLHHLALERVNGSGGRRGAGWEVKHRPGLRRSSKSKVE